MKTQLKEAIEFIIKYPYQDNFVNEHFSHKMSGGEPSDNSIELADYWNDQYEMVIEHLKVIPATEGKSIDELLKGCKHDGSFIPVDEVKRLMIEYASQSQPEGVDFREMHLNMQYYMEYCQSKGYVTPQEWIEKHKHF